MVPNSKICLTSSIKKALSNIHEKYVLVPADKAANNMTYLHCLQHSLFEHLFNLYVYTNHP